MAGRVSSSAELIKCGERDGVIFDDAVEVWLERAEAAAERGVDGLFEYAGLVAVDHIIVGVVGSEEFNEVFVGE